MILTEKQQQRQVIHFLWKQGIQNAQDIHQRTNIKLSTIYYNLKKLKTHNSIEQREGAGRPRKLNKVASRIIGQSIRRIPTISVKGLKEKLQEKGIVVGRETIRRHLHNNGYKNALPLATPMLTDKHKQKRVEWAQKHLNYNWSQVLFTDETCFQLFRNTITQWYKGTRPICKIPKDRHKINVWGAFCINGPTNIHCFKETMDAPLYVEILKKYIHKGRELIRDQWTFQQDNDPKHTSKLAKEFINNNTPNILEWPSNSPDLNPIENLWSIVKRNVEKRRPKNFSDLEEFMIEEWNNIPEQTYRNLINSMNSRCHKIIEGQGERIK
jgi:transposase